MRSVPSYISERLKRNIQTRANDSAPSSSLWVGRPTTVMVDDTFLERQTVLAANAKDVSIAVCHPKANSANTHIYMAYISDGVAKVVMAAHKYKMSDHFWRDTGFSEEATAVSIAYNGTMPKAIIGDVEFVTEDQPWVFWVSGGALYGRRLGGETVLLAETNCTDVSAIRAMWSSSGGFDFGLIVFFILDGVLYYRQLIDGTWMDAEVVSFGPEGVVWCQVAAFRTWDYRVGVQVKSTGDVYHELFTQFMGIGKQNTEHVEITNINAESDLIGVTYHNMQTMEHVEIGEITAGAPYGGLYSTAVPTILSVRNIDDGYGNWGKKIVVSYDIHLDASSIASNYAAFTVVDSDGTVCMPRSAVVDETGLNIILTFTNFNSADGECTLVYTPGNAVSMANTSLAATEFAFTPIGLVDPGYDEPVPVRVWNTNAEGTEIAVEFNEPLIGSASGNESGFSITTKEYNFVPDGSLTTKNKTIIEVAGPTTVDETVDLSSGQFAGVVADNGQIKLDTLGEGSAVLGKAILGKMILGKG